MIGHDPPPPNPKGGERVPHAGYRIRVGGAHNDASEQAVSPCDGGVQMGRTVVLDEQVNTACDITGTSRNASTKRRLTQKSMRDLPTQGRSAILWMAVAMLAMTWASETQASPDQARHLADTQHATAARNLHSVGTAGDGEALPPSGGVNDRSVQVVQATPSDARQPPAH